MERTRDYSYSRGIPSTAAVANHPIHPMLVNFPIAFLSSGLATDVTYLWTGDVFWAKATFWVVAFGFTIGMVAAVAGLTDYLTVRRIRHYFSSSNHMVAAIMLLATAFANLLARLGERVEAVYPWGIVLSAVTALMVAVAGWLGGKLVFEYNVGTAED